MFHKEGIKTYDLTCRPVKCFLGRRVGKQMTYEELDIGQDINTEDGRRYIVVSDIISKVIVP